MIRDLGTLGGRLSEAKAINDRGQIVGGSWTKTGGMRAVVWENGDMTAIATLGRESEAVAINDQGLVIGRSGNRACVWENGQLIDLGTLGGRWSEAVAINNRGQIVGSSETRRGASHAVLWTLQRG